MYQLMTISYPMVSPGPWGSDRAVSDWKSTNHMAPVTGPIPGDDTAMAKHSSSFLDDFRVLFGDYIVVSPLGLVAA